MSLPGRLSAAVPRVLAVLTLGLGLSGPAVSQQVVEDAAHGFRLELPGGWTRQVQAEEPLLWMLYPEDPYALQLSVRVYPGGRGSAERGLADVWAIVTAGEEYREPRRLEGELLGRTVPALEVEMHAMERWNRVRQLFVEANGSLFVLQTSAAVEAFEAQAELARGIWASFELFEPASQPPPEFDALVERCGSEVAWAASWDAAVARARDQRLPILVVVRNYPGFELSDDLATGYFMDPDIVALANARTVPLRLTADMPCPLRDHDVYGMGPLTFGTGALLVTPDAAVVRDGPAPTYEFLLEAVTAAEDWPGREPDELLDPVSRAAGFVDRGEFARARTLLEGVDDARADRQLARIHRLQREGAPALEQLERARVAPGGSALAARIDVDAAWVHARSGDAARARELLERVLAEEIPDALRAEALFGLGLVQRARVGAPAAESTWRDLIRRFPDERWAWHAAAILTGTAWKLGYAGALGWPPEADYAELRFARPAPLPLRQAPDAAREAFAWLLDHQGADGSWFSPSAFHRDPAWAPDDFELAIAAICARALVGHAREERALEAFDRAVDFVAQGFTQRRAADPEVWFIDYGVWSRAYALELFADAVRLDRRPRGALEDDVRRLVEELAARAKPDGGWSYYVTRDVDSAAADPVAARSISFTTAAVLLGLCSARDAGFDVPDELIDGGADALEAMRDDAGVFEYFLTPPAGRSASATTAAGAAGRGPACALALLRARRGSRDDLRDALDLFLRHRHALANERGKSLLHTGPDAQGSHYVMFDYATAAAAARELPERQRGRYRDPLAELVLQARLADGGFLGDPGRGVACATGMALSALDESGASGH